MTEQSPPAGWYTDPSDQSLRRYWDGSQWTEHTAPAFNPQHPPQQRSPGGLSQPTPPSSRSSSTHGRPVVVGVLGFVLGAALGGVAVAVAQGGSSDNASPRPAPATVTVTAPPSGESTSAPGAPETATAEPSTSSGGAALPLKTLAAVGQDYRVSVRDIDLDANDVIASANPFNEPPKGRYVLATIRAKYVGGGEGDPWIDLTVKYVGTDHRQYDESSCDAVVPRESYDQPTLQRGGTANYQVCFDIPPQAIEGGEIFVEDSLSFSNESRVYWQTR
jgi:hypothetical protein